MDRPLPRVVEHGHGRGATAYHDDGAEEHDWHASSLLVWGCLMHWPADLDLDARDFLPPEPPRHLEPATPTPTPLPGWQEDWRASEARRRAEEAAALAAAVKMIHHRCGACAPRSTQ